MWVTKGQDRAVQLMQSALVYNRISHAYLISGPVNVGKTTFALDIARALNCLNDDVSLVPCGICSQCKRISSMVHTDVFLFDVQSGNTGDRISSNRVTVDNLREDFISQVYKKPFEGKVRIFIISGVNHMRVEQANVILKTLEEPPDDTVILLLSDQIDGIIETIVSRCQLITLDYMDTGMIENHIKEFWPDFETYSAREIARLSKGLLGWAHNAVTDDTVMIKRDELVDIYELILKHDLDERLHESSTVVEKFRTSSTSGKYELDVWMTFWRDILLVKTDRSSEITNISREDNLKILAAGLSMDQIIKSINLISEFGNNMKFNVNLRLIVDNLMLNLPQAS